MLIGFGEIGQHFSNICTETFKKNVHNAKRRRPRFQKMKNCFFNIWFCKSQTNDLKPILKRSFDNQGSPNVTLHLNKKHVLFQVERSEEVLETDFLVTTKETSPAKLKKTFYECTQRRFGKFLFCSRNKSCFYKYSISQDISNAGCEESKYQT